MRVKESPAQAAYAREEEIASAGRRVAEEYYEEGLVEASILGVVVQSVVVKRVVVKGVALTRQVTRTLHMQAKPQVLTKP